MTDQAEEPTNSKAEEITRIAQELIQTVGYDGFSYRDVAERVGIRSATIHYYFPTKSDLALAVSSQYRTDFAQATADLTSSATDPLERLDGFVAIFQDTLEELKRVCLCAMLASEANSLSNEVRQETERFFADQEKWLAATIEEGIKSGQINEAVQPDSFAQMFLSALEGAMIMAMSMKRPQHLADVAAHLMSLLSPHSNTVS